MDEWVKVLIPGILGGTFGCTLTQSIMYTALRRRDLRRYGKTFWPRTAWLWVTAAVSGVAALWTDLSGVFA